MLIGDETKNDSQWEGVLDLSWGVEPRPFFRVDRIDVNEGRSYVCMYRLHVIHTPYRCVLLGGVGEREGGFSCRGEGVWGILLVLVRAVGSWRGDGVGARELPRRQMGQKQALLLDCWNSILSLLLGVPICLTSRHSLVVRSIVRTPTAAAVACPFFATIARRHVPHRPIGILYPNHRLVPNNSRMYTRQFFRIPENCTSSTSSWTQSSTSTGNKLWMSTRSSSW